MRILKALSWLPLTIAAFVDIALIWADADGPVPLGSCLLGLLASAALTALSVWGYRLAEEGETF